MDVAKVFLQATLADESINEEVSKCLSRQLTDLDEDQLHQASMAVEEILSKLRQTFTPKEHTPRCRTCRQTGQTKKDCPMRVCNCCGKQGHFHEECPLKQDINTHPVCEFCRGPHVISQCHKARKSAATWRDN
ncbi:hypothetical protein ACHAPJ_006988 [Fusarium lateritium]